MVNKLSILYKISGLSNNLLSVGGRLLLAAIFAVTGLFMYLPVKAFSTPLPVNLSLDGFGASPWSIPAVIPGDSGVSVVTLKNTGTKDGNVSLWLSNIRSLAGPLQPVGATGSLQNYLQFNLFAAGLDTTIDLPAKITDFPQSPLSTDKISLGKLKAGESVDLVWQWQFPNLNTAQNDAQGNTLIFNINYFIEEIPAVPEPPPPPDVIIPEVPVVPPVTPEPPRTLKLVLPGASVATQSLTEDNTVGGQLAAASGTAGVPVAPGSTRKTSIAISILGGALVLNSEIISDITGITEIPQEAIPDRVEATILPDLVVPLPDGWVQVSDFVRILGYTDDKPHGLILRPAAHLILGYDTGLLPEITDAVALFFYDENNLQWVQLQQPPGYIAREGEMAAEVSHFSLFIVLARPGEVPDEPPEVIVPPPVLAAEFVIRELIVNPPQIYVGERTTVVATVVNTGGITGEYRVTLQLDGNDLETKLLTLDPGQSIDVQFLINPDLPGVYQIDINGMTGQLNVLDVHRAIIREVFNYWWLLLLLLSFIIMLSVPLQIRTSPVSIFAPGTRAGSQRYRIIAGRPVKELVIIPEDAVIPVGGELQIKLVARFEDGSEEDVTSDSGWEIHDPFVARVDFDGLVTAMHAGTTVIKARWQDSEIKANINVVQREMEITRSDKIEDFLAGKSRDISNIYIYPYRARLKIGDTQQFQATLRTPDGHATDISDQVTWFSSNDLVIYIDNNGEAKAFAVGTALIGAMYLDQKGYAFITVVRDQQ